MHKVIQMKAAGGSATARYEGRAECAVTAANGEIGLTFQGVQAMKS
ncbi:MAG: hypothetical protein JNM65_11865 [Verrucomicrobiaceae bacterium]|nr:hypothetical protein [Verrucomicrobiaceae bacterium]